LTVPILRKVSSGPASNDHLPDIGSEDRSDARIGRRARIKSGSLLVTVDMRVVSWKVCNRALETDILNINIGPLDIGGTDFDNLDTIVRAQSHLFLGSEMFRERITPSEVELDGTRSTLVKDFLEKSDWPSGSKVGSWISVLSERGKRLTVKGVPYTISIREIP